MKTKTIAKKLKTEVSDLVVDLDDILCTFPEEMSVQDKQYFEMYVGIIKETIRDLDIELELYKENEEDEDGGA